jgi:predicted component of type VI protein secretion system
MTFVLSLRRGHVAAGTPARWPLTGTDCVVGAGPDCDWRLEGVAARHCQFGHRGGQWLVVDLGGGTMVNGHALDRPVPVAAGDMVAIGGCVVAVEPADAAPEAAPGDMAGTLLRLLVAGLVEQLADRARAKAEMGAEATQFALGAVNPLKALPPEQALAALLTPAPGMMPAERAVADAFADLAAHQAATLAGMQGALAATLARFSPAAIRGRAQAGGLMARVLPGAKEAALWQAYEREFDGVVAGSSDAFVDLFAREFASAYRGVSSGVRPPS